MKIICPPKFASRLCRSFRRVSWHVKSTSCFCGVIFIDTTVNNNLSQNCAEVFPIMLHCWTILIHYRSVLYLGTVPIYTFIDTISSYMNTLLKYAISYYVVKTIWNVAEVYRIMKHCVPSWWNPTEIMPILTHSHHKLRKFVSRQPKTTITKPESAAYQIWVLRQRRDLRWHWECFARLGSGRLFETHS